MLSDAKLRKLKPTEKKYKIADSHGLFAVVMPNGSILWRMRYVLAGKRRELALGKYPAVSLSEARQIVLLYREQIERGVDPHAQHVERHKKQDGVTVAEAVELLLSEKAKYCSASYLESCRSRLSNHVLSRFGARALAEVSEDEWRALINWLDNGGKNYTAIRVQDLAGELYKTVRLKTGLEIANPILEIRGTVKKKPAQNYPRITNPARFGELLHAIDYFNGRWQVYLALKFLPLVFCRQIELRRMVWQEVDFERALWCIPAEKIKMRRAHLVPLSTQAIAILRQAEQLRCSDLVFCGVRNPRQPISVNTIGSALRTLGFGHDEMVGHGFRGTAATLLNELGWDSHIVDFQLAHWQRSSVSSAYNHAEYLTQRREMMQAWADYCDELKAKTRKRLGIED